MPHVIVKLWAGKTERQKQDLAAAITQSVTSILSYGEDAVSVSMEEVAPGDWTEKVYKLAWCTDRGCGRIDPNPVRVQAMRT